MRTPRPITPEDAARFVAVWVPGTDPAACWEWPGARAVTGYGVYRGVYAHRLAWVAANGRDIPTGTPEIRHYICDNPACTNPAHLLPGTHAENMADMIRQGRCNAGKYQRAKTHCPSGHPYEGDNLVISKEGYRRCRECRLSDQDARSRAQGRPVKSPPFCPQGHEFTPENTGIRRSGRGFSRRCKECARLDDRLRRARKLMTTGSAA